MALKTVNVNWGREREREREGERKREKERESVRERAVSLNDYTHIQSVGAMKSVIACEI